MPEVMDRSARKREAIMSAGQDLFLGQGYLGTSVDQIAAAAAVSKQTVYKHFGDKQELLLAIVNATLDGTMTPFLQLIAELAATTDLESDLNSLARDYLRAVLQDQVVQLRRLVVGEANRLPELAHTYYERAPRRVLIALAECFAVLHERGLLNAPQPSTAAEHFAFLVVGRCIDQAIFVGGSDVLGDVDVDDHARAGVRVFLAGYVENRVAAPFPG